MKEKHGYVYIMTNQYNTTLYVGVTSDLISRIVQHKLKVHPESFTARYNLNKLVYFEYCGSIVFAITREKQIKKGNRFRKIKLINSINQ
jgi:putative endonuclease